VSPSNTLSLKAFVLAAGLLLSACPGPAPQRRAKTSSTPGVNARVEQLLAQARAQEPTVSALLRKVAAEHDGTLVGFSHRLKTRRSMTRKIKLILSQGKAKTAAEVILNDALRYTVQVADNPAGRYVATIKTSMSRLQKLGHRLIKLKNYWPRGDNYSGVNSVLLAPSKLRWELQFHTPASYKAQKATRAQYEKLRARATPLADKRALFDAMAKIWDSVPLPEGVLATKGFHPAAQLRTLSRP
jgi:hypothetical protein